MGFNRPGVQSAWGSTGLGFNRPGVEPPSYILLAKQMVKERQGMTGSNSLKGVSGKVIVDEKAIKDSWKEYIEKLTNEENELGS